MTTRFTATFRNGDAVSRSSEAAYTHAARRPNGTVSFHASARLAAAAATTDGEVVSVADPVAIDPAPDATRWFCRTCGADIAVLAAGITEHRHGGSPRIGVR